MKKDQNSSPYPNWSEEEYRKLGLDHHSGWSDDHYSSRLRIENGALAFDLEVTLHNGRWKSSVGEEYGTIWYHEFDDRDIAKAWCETEIKEAIATTLAEIFGNDVFALNFK